MARNKIYRPKSGDVLVLDVQADLLDDLNTRVLVSLMPESEAPTPARFLNQVFMINGAVHVMVMQFLSAVPVKELSEHIGSLDGRQSDITRALDMLFQGFWFW
ncbi:CcdB family protein [Roseibium alexandrii]|uniref:Toxin CcdB n=1 Tax=Roseibium alexandrii TaxID=388408 RepID=A0A0M7APD4_9HYPH|nr:CcdB family protein [Roseibium alexandrii]CTQ75474.1 plasmid maintenance protein CcdB [Roseibium alexandrii]